MENTENVETTEKKISKFTVEIIVEDGEIKSSVEVNGLTTLEIYGVASLIQGIVDAAIDEAIVDNNGE